MKEDTIDQNTSMGWRDKVHEVIFEADTKSGKYFDIALLISILSSVLAVSLESVDSIDAKYHLELVWIEWFFTILFTIEYILRIIGNRDPENCCDGSKKYIISFYGIIDFVAIIPVN